MQPIVNNNYAEMSGPQLRDCMADIAVAKVNQIVADNQRRLAGSAQTSALLNAGVFYGNEYYEVLKAKGEKAKAQLNALVKTGEFICGRAPGKYLTKVASTNTATGFHLMQFRVKAGILPTEALRELQKGLSLLDCGTVCQIGSYEALKEVLGEEKFNLIFSSNGPNPLVIGTYANENPIICLAVTHPVETQILKGQWVYFRNISMYGQKHRIGNAQGYMTLCCDATSGQERYVTLGGPAGGWSHEEIMGKLRAEYNATPLKIDEMVTRAVKTKLDELDGPGLVRFSEFCKNSQISQEVFDEEIRGSGGAIRQIIDWRIDLVQRLINHSAEEGQQLLRQWNQRAKEIYAQEQAQQSK